MNQTKASLGLLLFLMSSATFAADELSNEVVELRQLLEQVKSEYETRIEQLELRLDHAEQLASEAKEDAEEAHEIAEDVAIAQTTGNASSNAFNPAIGAVLSASYRNVGAGWAAIPGVLSGGELGPGVSGFSLGESEVNLKASVDPNFFGNLTIALEEDDGESHIAVEEAWIQTTGLGNGLTLTGGRFFSGAGYLNSFHRHADDFADRPLPYQAFLGGQYIADGLQLRWLAPTAIFLELGAEFNWGGRFPATANGNGEPSAWTLFGHAGGDIGSDNSWQIGLSYISSDVVDRFAEWESQAALFTGDSDLFGIDFVWKWAPQGNATVRNFKLQGEYFQRSEDGNFDGLLYDGEQTAWYLQAVWQFMQRWRVGYRHDTAMANNGPLFVGTLLDDLGRDASRDSVMLDWSLSEFSRLRLQWTGDRVLADTDNQLFLQYFMSIGAHGGHSF